MRHPDTMKTTSSGVKSFYADLKKSTMCIQGERPCSATATIAQHRIRIVTEHNRYFLRHALTSQMHPKDVDTVVLSIDTTLLLLHL